MSLTNVTSDFVRDAESDVSEMQPPSSGGILSYKTTRTYQWVCYVILEGVAVFGTVTNILNLICFVKHGMKDPVIITLFGLAISDLASVVTLLWTSLCLTPGMSDLDLPFNPIEVQYLVTGWPHNSFTRITSWITALITVERCLCITMPLKVNSIITRKRVTSVIIGIFIIICISFSPVYFVNIFAMKFDPVRNKTFLGIVYTENRNSVEQITFTINSVFLPLAAFIVITISTIFLVSKLKKQTTWRSIISRSSNSETTADRDQKVSKMVVMISVLFIACFIPGGALFLAMVLVPDLAIGRRYQNMLVIVYGTATFLECTNSSINIFIYYHMSTRYRTILRQLFRCQTNGKE